MPDKSQRNSLIFGLAFAGAALATGGGSAVVSLAWFVGSTLGSLLGLADTESTQEGPRQTEFKTTTSQYGSPIPRGYGGARMGGNIIWTSRIKETAIVRTSCITNPGLLGTSIGRTKSCQTIVKYVYTQSWFTALCEGPIEDVVRVWMDGKTVYNLTNSGRVKTQITQQEVGVESARPVIRVVKGGFDQPADSHMVRLIQEDNQAFEKQTPAYRGIAGLMIIEADLGPFGYRVPSVSAEVLFKSSAPSECFVVRDLIPGGRAYGDITPGTIAFQNPDQPGIILWFEYVNNTAYILAIDTTGKRFFFDRAAPFKADGHIMGMGSDHTVYARFITDRGMNINRYSIYTGKRVANYVIPYETEFEVDFAENTELLEVVFITSRGGLRGNVIDSKAALMFSQKNDLFKLEVASEQENNRYVPNTELRGLAAVYRKAHSLIDKGTSIVFVGDHPQEAVVYALSFASTMTVDGVTGVAIIQIWRGGENPDYRVVRNAETGKPVSTNSGKMFWETADQSLIIICDTETGANCFKWDLFTQTTIKSASIPYFISDDFAVDVQIQNGSFNGIWQYSWGNKLYSLDTISLEIIETIESGQWWGNCSGNFGNRSIFIPESNATVVLLENGLEPYVGYHIGQPQGIPLNDILRDQMLNDHMVARFGLDESDLELNQLNGRQLSGVVYRTQQPIRGNLTPLQQSLYFDYFESDGKIKAVSRQSKISRFTIDEDELSAREGGSEQSARLVIARKPESEMPRELSVSFTDYQRDYEQSTVRSVREVTKASAKVNISLPVMFTSTQAKQIAENLLDNTWLDRTSYAIAAPMKYLRTEPSDVFTVRSSGVDYLMRANEVAIGSNKMLLINASAEDVTKYNSDSETDIPIGWQQDETIGDAYFVVYGLEMSLRNISNSEHPFNAVVIGVFAPSNTSFNEISVVRTDSAGIRPVGRITTPTIGGVVDGDSPVLSIPENPAGNQAIQYDSPVIVNLYHDDDELQSIAREELFNNRNLCVIGNEVLGFQTATQLEGNRWEINGFIRGLSNTVHNMGKHVVGETFMILDGIFIDTQFNGNEGTGAFYKMVQGSRELTTGVILDGASFAPNCVTNLRFSLSGFSVVLEWAYVDRENSGLEETSTPTDAPLRFRVELLNATQRVLQTYETGNQSQLIGDTLISLSYGGYRNTIYARVVQIGQNDLESPPVTAASYFPAGATDSSNQLSIDFTETPGPGVMPVEMRAFWALPGYDNWQTVLHAQGSIFGQRSVVHKDPAISGDAFLALPTLDFLDNFTHQIQFIRSANDENDDSLNVRMVSRAFTATIDGVEIDFGIVCGISGSGRVMHVVLKSGEPDQVLQSVDLPNRIIPGKTYIFRVRMHGLRIQAKVYSTEDAQPGWLINDDSDNIDYPLAGTAGFGAEDGTLPIRVIQYDVFMNGETIWQ